MQKDTYRGQYVPHFNSIKVRLELETTKNVKQDTRFQFHKGTIRTAEARQYCCIRLYFNSIKVRLELTSNL